MARIWRSGATRCRARPRWCCWRRRPTRCWTWSTCAAVADLAHAAGAIVVVDNVFATPLLQQPLKFGADVVVYSCTKHMDGQGRVLGGAVLGTKKWVEEVLQPFTRNTGPAISPFNAWVILKGLETLACGSTPCAAAPSGRRLPGRAAGGVRALYPFRADHPQQALARRQMSGGGTLVTFELARRQGRRLPLLQRAEGDRRLQQPRRCEVDGHPPGDHDAYAHRRGGAGEARHHRRHDPALGRAGGRRRPDRRPGRGARCRRRLRSPAPPNSSGGAAGMAPPGNGRSCHGLRDPGRRRLHRRVPAPLRKGA